VPANCIIDVSEYYDRKIAAMLAHKTQITAEDPFMRLPEDMKRDFFGREYFHRADPALADGVVITDFMQDA
jgi:LmbE family N-acetylglucosaminyl deacetylase